MRVLYLFRSIAVRGGIERVLVDKMNLLASQYDYDVHIVTTDQGTHPIPYKIVDRVHKEDLGICFYRQYQYHILYRIWIAYKMRKQYEKLLRQYISDKKPDIIVCTTADHIHSIVKVKGSTPLVLESHSICNRTIESGKTWLLRKYRKNRFLNILSHTDCLVTLTDGDAKVWRKYHTNVEVIPNFISFNQNVKSPLINKDVIFVGRFDYQKRAQDAIRIWSIVRDRFPDWTLNIYGEGDMEDEIKKLAADVGGVVVHQSTDAIFDSYKDSSILILTSLFEPFGLVIVEAMKCGLPVVAFDCPYGPSSIISDGTNGFLVPQNDFDEFARKVSILIGSLSLRLKMGEAGISAVMKYSPSVVMPQWIMLFDKVISKKKHE